MSFYEESICKEGYIKTLLDVKNWLSKHPMALKYNKLYNKFQDKLYLLVENKEYNLSTYGWSEIKVETKIKD